MNFLDFSPWNYNLIFTEQNNVSYTDVALISYTNVSFTFIQKFHYRKEKEFRENIEHV